CFRGYICRSGTPINKKFDCFRGYEADSLPQ
ncbi:unnamed protein product, partial [Allacma fusca]